ncbi:unnamed protein product [Prunus armeniaca]
MKANYTLNKLAKILIDEIVRLHGVPVSIVSDRDPLFTSRLWAKLNEAFGTQLRFGETGMSIEMSPFMEFAYNNNYQVSEDVERTKKQAELIRERLKAAQDRQKSYANNRRKDLQFEVGG